MTDILNPTQTALELTGSFSGEAAFMARNLTTGEEISYRPDRVMPTASTIKVLVLAELFRQVDAGLVDLEAVAGMVESDTRGGSGILKDLSPALSLPLRDYATLMIALSDNVATAVLVRLLGRERVLQSAAEWGLLETSFGFVSGGDPGDYAASTPRDITRLMELIATDAIISPSACQQMRDILLTQQYHDQIGRYLPYSQYRRDDGPVVVRSKSGFMQGIRVDAGIVDLPNAVRYVLCLMTEGSSDRSFSAEHEGAILNGRVSRLIFDASWPRDVPMGEG
jgi:beta-lactamase class A